VYERAARDLGPGRCRPATALLFPHRTRPTLELTTLLFATLGLGLGGVVKGVTGMGLPLIGITVLATFLGVPHAIAILVVPTLVTNAWQLWSYRRSWQSGQMPFLVPMLVFGAVGIGIGTWLLVQINEAALQFGLAVMLLAYVALRLSSPHFRIRERLGVLLSAPVGLAAGVLQGATGISAPIGVTFIHAMRFERSAHVFAVSAMFMVFAVAQVPALTVAGFLTPHRWLESTFALLPVALFMPVGTWIGRRVNHATFDKAILALLTVTALKLIADAVW
jgi:uncharacterized membrane protein YfcA